MGQSQRSAEPAKRTVSLLLSVDKGRKINCSRPEHVLYELVDQPFYYNVVLFFMARALAAGAFRHYKKWVDVCAIKKPSGRGHMILQFEDDALKAPIFPRYLANGSIDNT